MKFLTLLKKHTCVYALLLALILLITTATGCTDNFANDAADENGTGDETTDGTTTGGETTAGEEESTEPLPDVEMPSEDLLKEIQSDYFDRIENFDGTNKDDVRIVLFYHGVYNELAVVSISVYIDSDDQQNFTYFYDDEIGGHTFSMSSDETLYTWKNGEFIKLKDAYEQKLLTQDQIGIISRIHNAGTYISYM